MKKDQLEYVGLTDDIMEQTRTLDFLIQSLVKMSRFENGTIAIHNREVELQTMFQRLKIQFEKIAMENKVELEIMPTDLVITCDSKWMLEALCNFVDNAIKYTEGTENAKVTVCASTYTMFYRIDISDNGCGIPKKEQNQVFNRFYRSERTCEKPGVGIGLCLSRKIIQAEKGYIKLTSEENKGSMFSVFLPKVTKK